MASQPPPSECSPRNSLTVACLSTTPPAEDALLVAARTRRGMPISTEDVQIAAVALAHGLALATRNDRDFVGIDGLLVLNPWG